MRNTSLLKVGVACLATGAMLASVSGTAQAVITTRDHQAVTTVRMNHQLDVLKTRVTDASSFEITFSTALSDEIRTFVDGNPAYLAEYVRVSGGQSGETDAALNGGSLGKASGTKVYTVDGDDRSLRVVLSQGTTLKNRSYRVWLDGDGHTLSTDLLVTGDNGAAISGTSTSMVSLRGTDRPADKASIDHAAAQDSRTVRVVYGSPVLSGMPAGRYSGAAITLTADGASVHPTYVQKVTGTDSTTWDLTFGDDIGNGLHQVSIDGGTHKLITSAGVTVSGDPIGATFSGRVRDRSTPRITSVDVNKARDRITIAFDRKIDKVDDGSQDGTLAETPGGTGGSTLTEEQLLHAINISGEVEISAHGSSNVERNLEDVAAYAPDLKHLVIKVESGTRLKAGSRGRITLDRGAVTDMAGVESGRDSADFQVSRSSAPRTSYDESSPNYLHVDRSSNVTLRHNAFKFTDAPDDLSVRKENVENRLVNEEHDAIVVDNKYIKATFVPGYGGRMLSLIYKPTGHDLLYANPTGTPYGFNSNPVGQPGTSPFYQNWLMVWGGVFPTLTSAEHGKYWFLPWDYSIKQTGDSVAIVMTKKDTIDYKDTPSRYTYGATGLETTVTYSMSKTSPKVDMSVSIHNPSDKNVDYEYWTCTTLAPGAPSDAGSPTMEIVSPVTKVQRDSSYGWMADVDKPANPATPDDRFLTLDKLNKMVNWKSSGIAYGQGLADNPQGNWWGVINQENGEGVVRVGNNVVTPGMKFWEWGFNSSFDTNIFKNGSSARPYIELWAGTSNKFFEPAKIAAGATTSWTESFLPTMDLANVTNANGNGSAQIAFQDEGGRLTVKGDVFSTRVGDWLSVRLLDKDSGRELAKKSFTARSDESQDLTADVLNGQTVVLELTDRVGKELLRAEKTAG